jgi:signal peptidase I
MIGSRRGFLVGVASVLGLIALGRTRFRLSLVKGESMRPGLASGDMLVVDETAYASSAPRRGDIVVARDMKDLIVKRVVGLPGEVVEVHLGRLVVNGAPYLESHALVPGRLTLRSGRLLDGSYALLGDNRSLPSSVSVHAVLSRKCIVGRVVHVFRLGLARLAG